MKQYFGSQTKKSLENFPFPLPLVSLKLIYAIAEIKKAAAYANKETGSLKKSIADAIIKVCEEILSGSHDEQFVTCSLQGGAGTSINMNVNEVIASRATELLSGESVHPNDHVNLHQSTNDVNPSALRLLCIRLGRELVIVLDSLIALLQQRATQYKSTRKLGRTHMQDAVPTTVGEELFSYKHALERDKKRLTEALEYMYDLNLGGTAIGNNVSASVEYIDSIYKRLRKDAGINVRPAANMMTLTSSGADFCHLSSTLHTVSIDLSKMASDIRFLSSGPQGGIGEFHLPELQAGSSIMPGKVNPVIPESINQMYYIISGKHLSICQATADSHLELGIMYPVVADAIIVEFTMLTTGITLFQEKCIEVLIVDEKRCEELLEKSSAYATLFIKKFGYDCISALVKESLKKKKTFRQVAVENKLVTEKEFNTIIKKFI